MKFGIPENMSRLDKFIILIFALLLIAFWRYKHYTFNDILPTAIGMVLGLFASSGLRSFRNRKKPFFEIKDDILCYKTYWVASIQEYPLQNFDKKIETFKILFEEHLKAPGLSNQTESIYIGMLNKNEKKMFLEYLKEKVNSL